MPDDARKRTLLVATIAFVSAIALLAVISVYFRYQLQRQTQPSLNPVVEGVLSADSDVVAEQTRRVIQDSSSSREAAAWARAVQTQTAYQTATTPEARVAIVRVMIDNYEDAESPRARAYALNMLAAATIMYARENVAYIEIFESDPFRKFASTTRGGSKQNLLDYSISIYPTPEAYYLRAIVGARRIESALRPGTTIRLGTSASIETLRERARNLKEIIKKGDAVAAQNLIATGDPRHDALGIIWRGLLRALSLEDVALVDAASVSEAESTYRGIITVAEKMKDPAGQIYPAFKIKILYAHLYTARLLNAVGGTDNVAKARDHLSIFVGEVSQDAETYEDIYSMFNWLRGAVNSTDEAQAFRYRQRQTYVAMANTSPEFRNYLISQGWSL